MQEPLNPLERVIGLLLEPRKTLTYIRKNPDLLMPVIIIFLVNLFALPIQETTQDFSRMFQIPASRTFLFFVQISSAYLGWLIIGAIYLLFSRILGGTAGYRQMLSLAGYLQFIPLLGTLIITPVLAFTGNLITFSPAIFMDYQQRLFTPLGAFLERFDLLNLYSLFLLGLGFIIIAGISRTKTIFLLGFFWLMGTIFSVLGTLIF